ncbi:uncharacterized protein EV420DRAFT_1574959, partial [Desarmillaria tabescens]
FPLTSSSTVLPSRYRHLILTLRTGWLIPRLLTLPGLWSPGMTEDTDMYFILLGLRETGASETSSDDWVEEDPTVTETHSPFKMLSGSEGEFGKILTGSLTCGGSSLVMPSQSTLSKEEKDKVKLAIPAPSNKIFYATLARVYYAYPQPNEWLYSGLQGALVLTKNNSSGALSFKLVDLSATRGVIWEHEFYDGLDYFADRAFFHSFPGDASDSSRLD